MSHEQIQEFPLDRFRRKPQLRNDIGAAIVETMSRGFGEVGQLQPVRGQLCEDGMIDIVDGATRLLSAQACGLPKLKVILESKDLSPAELIQRQVIANSHRHDLKPVEKGNAVATYMKAADCSARETAKKFSWPEAKVSKVLSLLRLSEDLQRRVDSGEIPEDIGVELARIDDPAQREALAAQVLSGRLTRDALVSLRKLRKAKNSTSGIQNKDARVPVRVNAALGNGRSITVAGAGLQTLDVLIQWLEELLAKARKARPQGLAIQTFAKMLKDQAKQIENPKEEVPHV